MILTKLKHLINHVYTFLWYVPNVGAGLDASKFCDKYPDPSSEGMQNTYEHFDKQEIVPLIQLYASLSGPPKSGSATDSNGHSKNPRLEPTAKKHFCKIPIAKPEIVINTEHYKDISIQISQNLFDVSLQSLARVDTLLCVRTQKQQRQDVMLTYATKVFHVRGGKH